MEGISGFLLLLPTVGILRVGLYDVVSEFVIGFFVAVVVVVVGAVVVAVVVGLVVGVVGGIVCVVELVGGVVLVVAGVVGADVGFRVVVVFGCSSILASSIISSGMSPS